LRDIPDALPIRRIANPHTQTEGTERQNRQRRPYWQNASVRELPDICLATFCDAKIIETIEELFEFRTHEIGGNSD
jgi:hypothetical protein